MATVTDPDSTSLKGKNVVVLGMARQGKALARWLPTQGARVTLSDKRDAGDLADDIMEFITEPNVKFALGGHPNELLDDADVLCVSGGVPLNIPIVQEAFHRGIRVTNDAILFLERCPAQIIGISGSAGKTTTTTLVGEMCKKAGKHTWVGGNIGDVLLDHLDEIQPEDMVVMELSSFQLELADVSPAIACLLNITPNHLDRHGTMEEYARAKSQLFMNQGPDDILIYGRDNLIASALSDHAPGEKASCSIATLVADGACLVGERLMLMGNCSPTMMAKVICNRDKVKLRGMHNVSNILAACAVAGAAKIPLEAMQEVAQSFKGVPHRLELVATVDDVLWVNDSIATSPERVIAALESFKEPVVLLLGGRDKKLPWEELAAIAVNRCKALICFGEHGPAIAEHARRARGMTSTGMLKRVVNEVPDLARAVELAEQLASAGDVVLLSPGATSYDAYKDFEERGEHFRQLVERVRRKRM